MKLLIPIGKGRTAEVDAEDFQRISQYKWHVRTIRGLEYAYRAYREGGSVHHISMHREVLAAGLGEIIHHRDGDGLNNQKSNLIKCSGAQNQWGHRTKRKRTTSLYRGVSFDRTNGSWCMCIHKDNKRVCFQRFTCEQDAARAYDIKARELFGEFADLNFPGINICVGY